METTCPECGKEFDNFRGFSAHYAVKDDGKHEAPNALVGLVGESRLVDLYSQMSEEKVGEELGVDQGTVHNALQDIEVDTSNPQHSENPNLILSMGYELITHKDAAVLHHRLLAVAKFGFDAVNNHNVHHGADERFGERGVEHKRANWRENLSLMKQGDHMKTHGIHEYNNKLNYDVAEEMRQKRDIGASYQELMDEYDVCRATVYNVVDGRVWAE